jgi:hypothetical protein
MALATLSIDLVAQLARLEEGMTKAGRLAERHAQQIEKSFSGLRVAAAGLGGVIAGAFSVTAIQQFFAATVDGLDRLNDLKDATGASIENISALEDVALRTGSSFESVSTALVKLNSVLKEAKPGSGAAETLKAIGLSAEELKKIDPAEAMLMVAEALSKYADDGNKARIVQQLFGKSIQEVAPLLKDLAEKGRLVATVTTQQAEEAEKFNKQLADLSKNTTDAARSITGPLISALNETIEKFREFSREGKSLFNPRDLAEFQKQLLGIDTSPLGRVNQQIRDLMDALARPQLNDAARKQFQQDLAALEKQRDELQARQSRRPANEGGGKFALPSAPDVPDTGDKKKGPKLIDGLPVDRQEAFRQLEHAARAATDAAFRQQQLEESEAARTNGLKLQADQINATAEAQQRLNEKLQALLDATPDAKLEETRAEMQLLADAFQRGAITVEQFTQAAQARLGTLPENFKNSTDEMTAFADQAQRNIQDAFGDTIVDALGGDFDDIEKRWGDLLARMVAEAIAADIGNAIFGKGGGSGGGSQLAALFGGITSLFTGLPSFDVGTPYVPRDMVAKVHRGERIVPASQNRPGAMGSAAPSISQTNYIDSRTDQAQVAQIASEAAKRAVRSYHEQRMAGAIQ